MCCFTGPVESVSNTRIFGRISTEGTQSLIYQMALNTKRSVAMVLPIPVQSGAGENAVTFVNLEEYPDIFTDLALGFPPPSGGKEPVAAMAEPTGYFARSLKVVSVGAFDASYVPTVADFARLDKRFRLPDTVWDRLPGYRNFGFAVFKLKRGRTEPHPMAFTFPTSRPGHLFFPTLHIHDGQVHPPEEFDHTLYAQARNLNFSRWDESPKLAESFVKVDLSKQLVRPGRHVYKREITGLRPNTDIIVKPKVA
jgi:hypothetical protein